MRSFTERSFWAGFRRLPESVQDQAKRAYEFFRIDPNHPSLEFKRVGLREPVYSARIGEHYRALASIVDGDVVWFWIGPHAEYDRVIRQF